MAGQRICRKHGGKAPQNLAAGQERVQQQKAADTLSQLLWNTSAAPVTDSVSEMRGLAGRMRVAVDVLGSRLNERVVCPVCHRGPEPLDGPTGRAWLTSVRELRQLLAEMERLGIAERAVQLEADKVRLMAVAVGAVFDALSLTDEQRATGMQVLLAQLRAETWAEPAGPAVLEGGDAS